MGKPDFGERPSYANRLPRCIPCWFPGKPPSRGVENPCNCGCSPFATGCVEIHRRAEPLGGDAATPLSLRDWVGPSFLSGRIVESDGPKAPSLCKELFVDFAWIQRISGVYFHTHTSRLLAVLRFSFSSLFAALCCSPGVGLALSGLASGGRLAFCAGRGKGSLRWICVVGSGEPAEATITAETCTYGLRTSACLVCCKTHSAGLHF
jgi:hypothetical protein